MTNLTDYITKKITGKYFRERNSVNDIVEIIDFKTADGHMFKDARVNIRYPLAGGYGFIDSAKFSNYEPCSNAEIRRINLILRNRKEREEAAGSNSSYMGCSAGAIG